MIADTSGIALARSVTAANIYDITELAPLFHKNHAGAGKVGYPPHKPDAVQGDGRRDDGRATGVVAPRLSGLGSR
jgi:hypothetical protein